MASHLVSKLSTSRALTTLLSRSLSSASLAAHHARPYPSLSLLLRPLAAATVGRFVTTTAPSIRGLATRATSSSLNDPNPNWSNRPPKETILLDGCDFNHWLVVMEPPEGNPTRDEIIDSYIKTLAMVIGSEEEARMKIYSVSTRCYFAFGALVPEELSYKIKELPRVRWVLPDSYLDVKNKDYGGEPFINGQAVPYDPKYHEEWIRNNARANERNRRNDRPRNFDRSRNFDRRRENMQNRDFQNQGMQNPPPNMSGMPPNSNMPPNNMPPSNNMPPPNNMPPRMPPNNMGGNYGGFAPGNTVNMPPSNSNIPPNNMPPSNSNIPPNNMPPSNSYMPPNNMPPSNSNMPPNNMPPSNNMPPPNNMPPRMPPNMGGNYGGFAPGNTGNMGGMPPTAGWSGNMQQNTGDPAYQHVPNTQFQNNYNPNNNRGSPDGNPY